MKITVTPSKIPNFDSRKIDRDPSSGADIMATRRTDSVSITTRRAIRGQNKPVEFDLIVKFKDPEKPIEIKLSDLRRSWDEPKGADEWDGPSPADVFRTLKEDPDAEFDPSDSWRRDWFEIDGVEVKLETLCLNSRRFGGGTRYGAPRKHRIESVKLKAGGYAADDQKRRAMKDFFKRDEWKSELFFKFDELREFAFERDQGIDARHRAEKARREAREARRDSFEKADEGHDRETHFGPDVPEELTLDLAGIDPRDLPDLLDLIDVTVRELKAAKEWNEKVSE